MILRRKGIFIFAASVNLVGVSAYSQTVAFSTYQMNMKRVEAQKQEILVRQQAQREITERYADTNKISFDWINTHAVRIDRRLEVGPPNDL